MYVSSLYMCPVYSEASEAAAPRDEGQGKSEECVAVREEESDAPIIFESGPFENVHVWQRVLQCVLWCVVVCCSMSQ